MVYGHEYALKLAEKAYSMGEVPVGAVVVNSENKNYF